MITSLFFRSKTEHSNEKSNIEPTLQYSIILESLPDDALPEVVVQEDTEVKNFMFSYVTTLFKNSNALTREQKSAFGKYVQTEAGQTWFSRMVSIQRVRSKCVSQTTFYSLVQHFAIVFFECSNLDHFPPAKILMNMCFTFFHEVQVPGCEPFREYLSCYLKNQAIWRNLRFWNAAFFDALQSARIYRPVVAQIELSQDAATDEEQYQENITFGQLGTFICNMHAFGLEKSLCAEFLEKQCVIAGLPSEQEKILKDHMNRLYADVDNSVYTN